MMPLRHAFLALLLLLDVACAASDRSGASHNSNNPPFTQVPSSVLDNSFHADLFEGDLKLEKSFIDKFYSNSGKRDVMTHDNWLWPNKIFYYTFHTSVSSSLRTLILNSMSDIAASSCITFVERTTQGGYVQFQNGGANTGCYSDYIGYAGVRQIINLEAPADPYAPTCAWKGTVIHEIFHALGFWHEQSRPDRDSYITINTANIADGLSSQFAKRSYSEIDFQASVYDYGSVMHYPKTAFSKNGLDTISVSNTAAYTAQGSPVLGQRQGMSTQDILQLKRLYYCPGSSINGRLVVNVISATNLPLISGQAPSVSVIVTAVSSTGQRITKSTTAIRGTSFNINQALDFGDGSWQFFRVDLSPSGASLGSQTVLITQQGTVSDRHCSSSTCSGYVSFQFSVTGGTVVSTASSSVTTTTTTTTTAAPVTNLQGTLTIKMISAANLADLDPTAVRSDRSDPYAVVRATTSTGETYSFRTTTVQNSANPSWNSVMNFGYRNWASFSVEILDDDGTTSQTLLSPAVVIFQILSKGTQTNYRVYVGSSSFLFDFSLL